MRLKIKRDENARQTKLEVSQIIGGVRVGMVRYVTHHEIYNSVFLYRPYIARQIVELRREVRRTWG